MATWEDGPEYAPAERPSDFSVPPVPPLQTTPTVSEPVPPLPVERPLFDGPATAAAPLDQLVPVVSDQRDPARPFDVMSSTLTSMDSAWGAAHWSSSGPAAVPVAQPPRVPFQPPVAAWPAPTAPLPPVPGPPTRPGGFPPPGTPQWFGPGPVASPQQPPPVLDARAVLNAATPGLVIVLLIGGLFYFLSPILLGVAFFLSSRVKVAQQQVRRVFVLAWSLIGFVALATLLTSYGYFGDWWGVVSRWGCAFCWGLLITLLVLVYRALKRRIVPSSTYPHWG